MHSCSGMTVFKGVETKEVQKGLGKSAQRKKTTTVKCAYASKNQKQFALCIVCTNKSLGFMFNTYTPIVSIVISWVTLLTLDHHRVTFGWQSAYTINSYYNMFFFPEVVVGKGVSIPESKCSLRCCLIFLLYNCDNEAVVPDSMQVDRGTPTSHGLTVTATQSPTPVSINSCHYLGGK